MAFKKSVITVSIQAPDKVVWEGECLSLSSKNAEGTFDLLPDHARFLTLIHGEKIRLEGVEKDEVFSFEHAVIFFQDNSAKIYVHTP